MTLRRRRRRPHINANTFTATLIIAGLPICLTARIIAGPADAAKFPKAPWRRYFRPREK